MTLDHAQRPSVPISVIVPAYNMERYLGETLDSVLAQTVRPCEIIVVDDGSTDRTAEIAKAKGATVHSQTNRGLSAARNVGIARASAPWIAQLDGDDVWAPTKLELQWEAIKISPESAAVFSEFWQFDEDRCLNQRVIAQVHHGFAHVAKSEIATGVWRCNASEICELLPRECVIVPSTLIFRRDVLLSIGGYDETLTYSEDIELELRLLAHTQPLFVDVPLMGYRRHSSSMTSNQLKMRKGDIDVCDRVAAHPSRYLASTVEWYQKQRPTILAKAGRMGVAFGDHQIARDRLWQSFRAQKRISTLAWLALSYGTNNVVGQRILASGKQAWFGYKTRRSTARTGQ